MHHDQHALTEHLTGKTVARFVNIDKIQWPSTYLATRIVYQIGDIHAQAKTIRERDTLFVPPRPGDFVPADVNGRQRGYNKPVRITAKSGGMQEGVVEQNRKHPQVTAMVARQSASRRRPWLRQTQNNICGCTFSCSQANIFCRYAPCRGLYFIQNHQRAEVVTELRTSVRYPCGGGDHAAHP